MTSFISNLFAFLFMIVVYPLIAVLNVFSFVKKLLFKNFCVRMFE